MFIRFIRFCLMFRCFLICVWSIFDWSVGLILWWLSYLRCICPLVTIYLLLHIIINSITELSLNLVAFFVNLFINIALKRLQLLCSICERVSPLCQQLLIGYIYQQLFHWNEISNSQPQPRKFQTSNIQQYIRKPFNPRLLYPC